MSGPIVVLGAGGHAKVVADIVLASGGALAGFIDARLPKGTRVLDLEVLGDEQWLVGQRARVVLGVGDNRARARAARAVVDAGASLTTAIHPRAVVSPYARIGEGAVVMALAVVNPDAVIGEGAIVNTGAIVEHDCRVGAYAHVSPNAAMAGASSLGDGAHLGVGASLLPGIAVGEWAVVGGGALVRAPVAPLEIAFGVPARARGRSTDPPP